MAQVWPCGTCGRTLVGEMKVAGNGRRYHNECFKCSTCSGILDRTFYEGNDGRLLCGEHFFQGKGAVCEVCRQTIAGKVVTALSKKYHPDCFSCSRCRKPLSGHFQIVDSQPLCGGCASGLPVSHPTK